MTCKTICNICEIAVPEGEIGKWNKIFEDIISKNFINLIKIIINSQIQEAH